MATTEGTGPAPLTEEQQQAFRRAVPTTMLNTPYLSGLGLVFERYEPDRVTLRLPFREELTNDGTFYHGGVIAAVMDTAGARPRGQTTTSPRGCGRRRSPCRSSTSAPARRATSSATPRRSSGARS